MDAIPVYNSTISVGVEQGFGLVLPYLCCSLFLPGHDIDPAHNLYYLSVNSGI